MTEQTKGGTKIRWGFKGRTGISPCPRGRARAQFFSLTEKRETEWTQRKERFWERVSEGEKRTRREEGKIGRATFLPFFLFAAADLAETDGGEG